MSAIDMKILSSMRETGEVNRTSAVTTDGCIIEITTPLNADVVHKLQNGKFVRVLTFETYVNAKDRKVIKLSQKSRVFVTSAFALPDGFEEQFYNAPVVSICEALESKRNRRLSLQGVVQNVSPLKEGPKWRRRDVDIADPETGRKIRVKLWAEHASVEPVVDDVVIVTNVVTDTYKSSVSVEASAETTITVLDSSDEMMHKDVVISGFMISEECVELVTATNQVLYAAKDIVESCIGGDVTKLEQLMPYCCSIGYHHKSKDVIEQMSSNICDDMKDKEDEEVSEGAK